MSRILSPTSTAARQLKRLCGRAGAVAVLGITLTTLIVTAASADSPTFIVPLAAIDATGNVTLQAANSATATAVTSDANFSLAMTTAPAHLYSHLRWSPDGGKLAYQDKIANTLYVLTPGSPAKLVASNVATDYQTAWLADSSAVVYAVNTSQTSGDLKSTFNIQQIAPDGSNPQTLATFTAQEGCGGGGVDAAGQLYAIETGLSGNSLSLAWTKYGWLVSTSCTGSGLALVSFNNQLLWTAATLGRAAVSPSGALAAAVTLNLNLSPTALVSLDLSTGQFTPYTAVSSVDQVGWSADEQSLFFSTISGSQVTLSKLALQGAVVTPLFADAGRAVGAISSSPDSQMAVFSLISNVNPPTRQLLAVPAGSPTTAATVATARLIGPGGQPAFAIAQTLSAAPPAITLAPTIAPTATALPCVPRTDWTTTYTIVSGDTLSGIALRAGITTATLTQGNCIDSANPIYGGQVLHVPIPVAPPLLGKRITFSPGGTGAVVTGQVGRYPALDHWVIRVNAGQTLNVQVASSSGTAILIINGANGAVLLSGQARAPNFAAVVPVTQDYFIDVADISGAGSTYTLTVNVPPLVQSSVTAQRIYFAPGAVSATVTGQSSANGLSQWVIRILAGQQLNAQLTFTSGNAILIVYGADGTVLQTDHVGASSFSGVVPITEDYFIDVRDTSGIGSNYALVITIPPR